MTLALIDYGAGNLHSVENALRAAGADDIIVTADPDVVLNADRIVLPGVGAFGACMNALSAIQGMPEAMESATFGRGRPFLGVCVGMQLMAEYGVEHGTHSGLGWVSGTVAPMKPRNDVRIPHMGWNDVRLSNGGHALLREGEAYFLHSFAYMNGQFP
ncbi:MAG TPA: imidazole glycerol phosphate synthase subunit HisH, partial [Sphingomonas sp.]|nr:imidazole glycerol phosphate synthase subunit HisH [Sphingomonas sp.]